MSQWYYTSGGAQQGPVSTSDLQSWIANSQIALTELVWREGMADWKPISQVPELAASAPAVAGGYGVSDAQYPGYAQQAAYGGQPANPYANPNAGGSVGYATPLQYHNPSYGAQLVYAGFWWRFLASFIDGIIVNVGGGIIGFVFGFAAGSAGVDLDAIEIGGNVLGLLIGWLYAAGLESSVYQGTLGKKICGITVTDMNGQRISFGRATGRHFGKIVSALILGIGYFMQPFTERRQALHDMMAGCLVLKRP